MTYRLANGHGASGSRRRQILREEIKHARIVVVVSRRLAAAGGVRCRRRRL